MVMSVIIYLFCFAYVIKLIKALPQDLESMRVFKAEDKMDFYYPELASFVIAWIFGLLIIVFMMIPVAWKTVITVLLFFELLEGFRI